MTAENLMWTRDALKWRDDNQGYSLFHEYENIPEEFAQQHVSLFISLCIIKLT